ncbi:hypothetical protein FVE85_6677 [Porphyridium purpureum]|uniref:Uncharacterized protein n=1 Tax=Porphyridium purpureum TaxID=35688 RepID=A0A5J4Z7S0_PORPP|nr:hypothetical protein FVE85_6677 [Porphyridium purpureum]|eukprot:POR6245..scf295_1
MADVVGSADVADDRPPQPQGAADRSMSDVVVVQSEANSPDEHQNEQGPDVESEAMNEWEKLGADSQGDEGTGPESEYVFSDVSELQDAGRSAHVPAPWDIFQILKITDLAQSAFGDQHHVTRSDAEAGDGERDRGLHDSSELNSSMNAQLKDGLAVAAANVSNGFQTMNTYLDNLLETPKDHTAVSANYNQTAKELFASFFQDAHSVLDEHIVDSFHCELVQKYRCYHNSITPEKTFTIRGMLFILEWHIAFASNSSTRFDSAGTAPVRLLVKMDQVAKVQQAQRGLMRLLMHDKSSLIVGGFQNPSDCNGASALIEHMKEEKV